MDEYGLAGRVRKHIDGTEPWPSLHDGVWRTWRRTRRTQEEAAMELRVSLRGEPQFVWTATEDDMAGLKKHVEGIAGGGIGGYTPTEYGKLVLGLFAHGQLPQPQNAAGAAVAREWIVYGILEVTVDTGTTVHELLRHGDVTCNIVPSGPDSFALELVGTHQVAGSA